MKAILSRGIVAATTLIDAFTRAAPADPATRGRYDRLIDAANRLPRPVLVFGTLALFALALLDPAAFERTMDSLRRMPEEMWWLIGAVLAGHFGAREAFHLRDRATRPQDRAAPTGPDAPPAAAARPGAKP